MIISYSEDGELVGEGAKANSDLKTIHKRHSDKEYIKKVVSTIVANSKQIVFAEQYQEDQKLRLTD